MYIIQDLKKSNFSDLEKSWEERIKQIKLLILTTCKKKARKVRTEMETWDTG